MSKKETTIVNRKDEESMTTESSKRYFPDNAEPPAAPTGAVAPKTVAKRTPWMKKPIENPHASPAGRCINFREEFDKYVVAQYKHITEEERNAAWRVIGMQMITEPYGKLKNIIDEHFNTTK
jgi:hypothetical protein